MVSINLREHPSTPSGSLHVPLDPSAFTAKLWNPPPPPPEVPEEVTVQRTVPRKPLRLQLVGIIDDGQTLRAAVYDPDTDRLLILASGDRVHQHTITSITAGAVMLVDGRVSHRLTLRRDDS